MIVMETLRSRTLVLIGLLGMGAGFAWIVGDRHPGPRTAASQPATVNLAASGRPRSGKAALVRLERDMEFSRRHESLTQLLATSSLDPKIRAEIERELWRLTMLQAAEHEAESALAAQGWTEATVTVIGDRATVVVHGQTLTELEAAGIGRLVAEATGLPEANTRIIEQF